MSGLPFKQRGDLIEATEWNQLVMMAHWEQQISSSPSLVPFILYDDCAPGASNVNAYTVKDDLTANTTADKVLLQNTHPGTFRGYGDAHTGFDATTAAKVLAQRMPDGKLHIVGGKGLALKCTAALTANAAPGGTVNVDTIVAIDGGQLPVENSTSATLSCTMPADASALDNAPCKIEWDEAADAWKITWVHQRAKRIRGTLGGALTTTTASQTISSPASMDGGQVPSGTLTGYNVYTTKGHAGPSGGVCAAEWNENTDHYEFYDVECV